MLSENEENSSKSSLSGTVGVASGTGGVALGTGGVALGSWGVVSGTATSENEAKFEKPSSSGEGTCNGSGALVLEVDAFCGSENEAKFENPSPSTDGPASDEVGGGGGN